jgi:hypothetical protein
MHEDGPNRRFVSVLDDEPTWRQPLHAVTEISFGLFAFLACTREPVENSRAVGVRL